MPTAEQYLRDELKYQHEGEMMKANLQNWKIEQLIIRVSVEFASRIKMKDCMWTLECFQAYLQALADTIANSDADTAFLLPAIQEIKNKVYGGEYR